MEKLEVQGDIYKARDGKKKTSALLSPVENPRICAVIDAKICSTSLEHVIGFDQAAVKCSNTNGAWDSEEKT